MYLAIYKIWYVDLTLAPLKLCNTLLLISYMDDGIRIIIINCFDSSYILCITNKIS